MVVQPGGIFAPAPDLREVLGKRGVNWLWGRSETCGGWLPPLAPVKQPARSLPNCPTIESRRFPPIRLKHPKGRRGGMGYRSAEEADRGYRGGACTDLARCHALFARRGPQAGLRRRSKTGYCFLRSPSSRGE